MPALATRARVPTYDTFGILARFGRDVAGAAVISATADEAHVGSVEPQDLTGLEAEVGNIEEQPLALHDNACASTRTSTTMAEVSRRGSWRPRRFA